jgi:hypothetical protein
MTLTIIKPRSVGKSVYVPLQLATANPHLLTRAGFHQYFRDRLSGFACEREDLVNWERLHLFTDCRLTPCATAIRAAYA